MAYRSLAEALERQPVLGEKAALPHLSFSTVASLSRSGSVPLKRTMYHSARPDTDTSVLKKLGNFVYRKKGLW